jgi:hypothetical protein
LSGINNFFATLLIVWQNFLLCLKKYLGLAEKVGKGKKKDN